MIDFGNCDILGYSHNSEFLGDKNIRYKITKSLSIQGNILSLSSQSGIAGIFEGIRILENSANDFGKIILRGVDFGDGIIKSINFDDANPVRVQKYTVDVDIFQEGNVNNLPISSEYIGIDYSNFEYIQDLKESLTYNDSFDKKEYSHEITVGILTSNSNQSLGIAKSLAQNLFSSTNILNCLGNYSNLNTKQSLYSESYDMLAGTASFDKKLTIFRNDDGDYALSREYSYQRGADGIINVSEKGVIKALVEPYVDVLSSAFKTVSNLTYNNCLDVFNGYKIGDNYALKDQPVTKGTTMNRFEKTLDYEFSYTNDLSVNAGFFWNYTNESSLGSEGLIESSENGEIIGFGHIVNEKFDAAKNGYYSIQGAIDDRVQLAYNRFKSFNPGFTNTNIFLTKKSEGFSPYNGRVSYSRNFSNDQNMLSSSSNLTRCQITVNEGFRVPIASLFNIPNLYELEQVSAADEVAQKSIDVNINFKRGATISDCVSYLLSIAPSYAGDFLIGAKYSYNPFSNSFNANINWGIIYE